MTNACQRSRDIDKITNRGAFMKTTIKDTATNSNWHNSKTNLREEKETNASLRKDNYRGMFETPNKFTL